MITTQQLIVFLSVALGLGLAGIVTVLAGWSAYKYYLLLQKLTDSLAKFDASLEAIGKLPALMEGFSKQVEIFSGFTKGHQIAAQRNANAVVAFSKVVEMLSTTLFSSASKTPGLNIYDDKDVDKEFKIQETMRENPDLGREGAEELVIGME